jgi:hypothetical protein
LLADDYVCFPLNEFDPNAVASLSIEKRDACTPCALTGFLVCECHAGVPKVQQCCFDIVDAKRNVVYQC